MQRHAMLMYTSCGWFFDELSGIETVQVMQYAGRALQLARDLFGDDLEEPFLERLAQAKSNIPEFGDGRRIYEKFVKPAMVDLLKVGIHYAISSLFEDYQKHDRIYCYAVNREDYRVSEVGKAKLAIGRIQVSSEITHNADTISFGVLHFGDHNLVGGVRVFLGEEAYGVMAWEVTEAFALADLPETIRRLDKHFGASTYSLKSLFRDEQRKVSEQIMELTMAEVWSAFDRIYSHYVPLMRFLRDLGVPLPKPFFAAAEAVLNRNLRRAFLAPSSTSRPSAISSTRSGCSRCPLDSAGLEYALRQGLENFMSRCRQEPQNSRLLAQLDAAVGLAQDCPLR
jgi:hypothetical protein